MCGKFTQKPGWDGVATIEDLIAAGDDARAPETINADARGEMSSAEAQTGREREVARMRWGFVPSNADDPNIGTKFIHARAETIEQKPTFREAFFQRRGLVAVETFNEGEEITPSKAAYNM